MKRSGRCLCLIGAVLLCVPAHAELVWTGDPTLTNVNFGMFNPFFKPTASGGDGISSVYFARSDYGVQNVQGYSYTFVRSFRVTSPGEFVFSSTGSAAVGLAEFVNPVFGLCIGWGISFSAVTTITGTPISQPLSGSNNVRPSGPSDPACRLGLANGGPGVADQVSDAVHLAVGSYVLQQTISVDGFAAELFGMYDSLDSRLIPVDNIPPTTGVTASPGPNGYGWNRTDVTINLNATDNPGGSGVKQIQFALGGAQNTGWETVVGNAASVTISAQGTTILSYFATDNAGNLETSKTLTVRIDKTPPVTSATPSSAANKYGWNNKNVTVNMNATDNPGGSGVSDIQFALGGGPQNTAGHTVLGNAASVTISAEGTTILGYFATDNVGNHETTKTLTVRIDKTPPTILGLPAPGCTVSAPNHQLVSVATVTAADALSGLVPSSFQVTGNSNNLVNGQIVITGGPRQFNVQLRADKGLVYTLTAVAIDLAGNIAYKQATCTVPRN